MNEKLKAEILALAKKHGMTVTFECRYCGEYAYDDDGEHLMMVTFEKPNKES